MPKLEQPRFSEEDREALLNIGASIYSENGYFDLNSDSPKAQEIKNEVTAIVEKYQEEFDKYNEIYDVYPGTCFEYAFDMVKEGFSGTMTLEMDNAVSDDIKEADKLEQEERWQEEHPKRIATPENDVGKPWMFQIQNGIEPEVYKQFTGNPTNPDMQKIAVAAAEKQDQGDIEGARQTIYEGLFQLSNEYREAHGMEPLTPLEPEAINKTIDLGEEPMPDIQPIMGVEYQNKNVSSGDTQTKEVTVENANTADTHSVDIPESNNALQQTNDVEQNPKDFFQLEDVQSEIFDCFKVGMENKKAQEIISKYVTEDGEIHKEDFENLKIELSNHFGVDIEKSDHVEKDKANTNDGADKSVEPDSSVYEERFQQHSAAYEKRKEFSDSSRDTFASYHKMAKIYNAYKGGIEIDGKVPTKLDVGLSCVKFMNTNLVETLIISALKYALDKEDKKQDTVSKEETKQDVDFGAVDKNGVYDNGYISKDTPNIGQDKIDFNRQFSSEAGKFYGADMTKPVDKTSNDIYTIRTTNPDTVNGKGVEIVSKESAEKRTFPDIRYVEISGNHVLIDPFGKIVDKFDKLNETPDFNGKNGSLSGLDVSGYRGMGDFLKECAGQRGITVRELKENISQEAMSRFCDRVEKSWGKELSSIEERLTVCKNEYHSLSSQKGLLERYEKIASRENDTEALKEIRSAIDGIDKKLEGCRQEGIGLTDRVESLKEYAGRLEKSTPRNLETRWKDATDSEKKAVGRSIERIDRSSGVDNEKIKAAIEKGSEKIKDFTDKVNATRDEKDAIGFDGNRNMFIDKFGINEMGEYVTTTKATREEFLGVDADGSKRLGPVGGETSEYEMKYFDKEKMNFDKMLDDVYGAKDNNKIDQDKLEDEQKIDTADISESEDIEQSEDDIAKEDVETDSQADITDTDDLHNDTEMNHQLDVEQENEDQVEKNADDTDNETQQDETDISTEDVKYSSDSGVEQNQMEDKDVERDNDNVENNPEDISNEPQGTEQNENDNIQYIEKDEHPLDAIEQPENDFSNDAEQDKPNDVEEKEPEETTDTEVERKTEDSTETAEDVTDEISENIDKEVANEAEQDVMSDDSDMEMSNSDISSEEDKKSNVDHVIVAAESEDVSVQDKKSSVDIESSEDVTASVVSKENEQSEEPDHNQSDTVKEELLEVFSETYDTVSNNENSENSDGSFKEWISDKLYEEYGAKIERISDILDGTIEMNYTDNILEIAATAIADAIADKLESMRSSDNEVDSSTVENMVEVTQDIMSTIGETVGSSMMPDMENAVNDVAMSLGDSVTVDILDKGLEGLLNSEVFNNVDASANTADEVTGEQPEIFSDDSTSSQMVEHLMNDIEQYYQNEVDFGIDTETDLIEIEQNKDDTFDTQDVDYNQSDGVDLSFEQGEPIYAEDFTTEAVDAEEFTALLL